MSNLRENLANIDYVFLKGMEYGVITPEVIQELGAVEVKYGEAETGSNTPLADVEHRLGPSESGKKCDVCTSRDCQGHLGYINFPKTTEGEQAMIYNPMYLGLVKKIFSVVCMSCCRLAIDENDPWTKDRLAEIVLKPRALRLNALVAMLGVNSQKYTHCVHYEEVSKGRFAVCSVKKKVSLSNKTDLLVEMAPTHMGRGGASGTVSTVRETDEECTELTNEDNTSRDRRSKAGLQATTQDTQARVVYNIFQYLGGSIEDTPECEYIGITKDDMKGYFQDNMLIIPTMFRPKIGGVNNKITQQYNTIITLCTKYKNGLPLVKKRRDQSDDGKPPIVQLLKMLQEEVANYHIMVRETLGGKKGALRSTVLGKRPNFNARSVILSSRYSEPNVIEVPTIMTDGGLLRHKDVSEENIIAMQKLLYQGMVHSICKVSGPNQGRWVEILNNNFSDNSSHILEVGDQIQRRAMDGDLVITGRQPTNNKHNIFSAHVKRIPGNTTKIHMVDTPGLAADFDGDAMHISSVQSEEAEKDLEKMLIGRNVRSDQRGTPMYGLTYNAVVAATLLTIQELEITDELWSECTQFYYHRLTGLPAEVGDLDERLALYGVPRRSGRALFSSTLPPDFTYEGGDGIKKVVIKKGILIEGMLSSSTVGPSSGSIVDQMSIEYDDDDRGWEVTYNFITDATHMLDEFIVAFGFTVTYTDCLFGQNEAVSTLLERKMDEAENNILKLRRPTTHYEKIKYEKDVQGIVNGLKSIAMESNTFSVDPKERDFLGKMSQYTDPEPEVTLAGLDISEMNTNLVHDLSFMVKYLEEGKRINPILEGHIERTLQIVKADVSEAGQAVATLKRTLSYVDCYIDSGMVNNNLIMMSKLLSGQKGNEGNLTSIGLQLGQQQVMGMRLPQTVTSGRRMLITQRPDSLLPESRGFIDASYISGMTPNETQFNSASVREGMASTSTITKNIGKIQRQLERSLEPIKIENGCPIFHENVILSFAYGGDGMDGLQLLKVKDGLQFCDLAHMARKINDKFLAQLPEREREQR